MVLALPLQAILVSLDFLVFLCTFGWVKTIAKMLKKSGMKSVPVDPKIQSHRVCPSLKESYPNYKKNPDYDPSVKTLADLFKNSCEKNGPKPALGTRKFLGWESKKPPVKNFGETSWRTFTQTFEEAMKFGAALREAGLVTAPEKASLDQITTPCSLAIFENTCAEWMIASHGAFSQSMIVTTLYATLGMDAVVKAVADGNISALVCNKKDVKDIMDRAAKGELKTLKIIIYTSDICGPDEKIEVPASTKTVKVVSFEDFVASGDTNQYHQVKPKPESTAVIMYTSGSTGSPKGVMLTHEQIISTSAGISSVLNFSPEDRYCGYLPMAHILELSSENSLFGQGCAIGFADPKTLTPKGSRPTGALEEFKPTCMAGVPKIWDTIKKGITARVNTMSPTKQLLINTAFKARGFALKNGYDTPLFNALVFKKFSDLLGGNMKYGLSGGGPLNSEVQEFVRVAFGMPLIQGYGLTETCAGLTVQGLDDMRPAIAGSPLPCCEVRLDSCADISDKNGNPYLNTDTVDVEGNEVFGRGEIVVKGSNVAVGYYMLPEKTKEDFEKDGWFHTGDIGQFMNDGSIKIVDRKKNLVKLKGGEYIAMEMMEMVYGNSKWVDAIAGGICCYGDGEMDRPIALIQLNDVMALDWAKSKGLKEDIAELKKNTELYDEVLKDLVEEHKKGGLAGTEKIKAIAFMDFPWTPENGCLTAANKLQRRAVIEQNKEVYEATRKKGIF